MTKEANKDVVAFYWTAITILAIASIFYYTRSNSLQEQLDISISETETYKQSFEAANDVIYQVASDIDDAKSNAWSDYESMGQALDALEKPEEITNPY